LGRKGEGEVDNLWEKLRVGQEEEGELLRIYERREEY
jgi:hypothetical protein